MATQSPYLFVFNDSPYGSQRTYNGLRLALALARKRPIRVFLFGDGVTSALAGPAPANPEYSPQEMLRAIADENSPVRACRTCMEARGLTETSLIAAVQPGTLDQLAGVDRGGRKSPLLLRRIAVKRSAVARVE